MNQPKITAANPAISIGIPVYNGENYIREAIDSALCQTFDDFELIISDNASTDDTRAICLDYTRRDPRIKYMRQPENLGPTKNFKLVANEASGTYFTWLAHDDRLKPDFLEVMVDYMHRHSQVVLAMSDFSITDASGKVISRVIIDKIREDIDWDKRLFHFFQYPLSDVLFAIYGVMKTEVCKKVLRETPDHEIDIGAEVPILCRFAVAGEIVSLPVILREWRRYSVSYSTTEAARIQEKGWFRGNLMRFNNQNQTRKNQLGVLFASPLPLRFKVTTLLWVLLRALYDYTAWAFRQVRDAHKRLNDRRMKVSVDHR